MLILETWPSLVVSSDHRPTMTTRVRCSVIARFSSSLVKTLGVPLDAYFSRIASRDKDEVNDRERETHRPPDGREEQRARARGDLSGQASSGYSSSPCT